jgi:hypothetical protein
VIGSTNCKPPSERETDAFTLPCPKVFRPLNAIILPLPNEEKRTFFYFVVSFLFLEYLDGRI